MHYCANNITQFFLFVLFCVFYSSESDLVNTPEPSSLSCAIYLASSLVLSGGKGALLKVAQYSHHGWLSDLPDLNVGRYAHACSSYSDTVTASQVGRVHHWSRSIQRLCSDWMR